MSSYTTEIRYICESLAGYDRSKGYKSIDEIIELSWKKIFPPSFEAFHPEYTEILAKKILKWYYTREIGCETFGLWQLRLDAKLSVIMPYYNKIYEAFSRDYDILTDVDTELKHERSSDGNSEGSTSAKSKSDASQKSKNKHSNTPQGGLDAIESDRYLSSADLNNSSSNNNAETSASNKSNFSTTEDFVQHITGKRGSQSYASMVSEYCEKLKNVDRMVINELSDLFILVWDWDN